MRRLLVPQKRTPEASARDGGARRTSDDLVIEGLDALAAAHRGLAGIAHALGRTAEAQSHHDRALAHGHAAQRRRGLGADTASGPTSGPT